MLSIARIQNDTYKPFRLNKAWFRDNGCKAIIEKRWKVHSNGSHAYRVTKSQFNTKEELRKWNHVSFGNINTQIHKIKCQIEELNMANNVVNTSLIEELKCKLNQWYDIEADFWKQRNKNEDLKNGERNIVYYH